MSLREKAREVKAAGEAERGNFTPNGVPKRVYQWWLSESNSKRARNIRYGSRKENFCHFWRVVLIWAPLLRGAYAIDKYIFNKYVGITLASIVALAVLIVAILNPLQALAAVGVAVFLTLQAIGGLAGASAGLTKEQRSEHEMLEDRRFIGLFFVLGLGLALPVYLGTRGVRFYKERLVAHNKAVGLTAVGLVLAGLLVLTAGTGSWLLAFKALLLTLTFVVGYVFVRIVVGYVADFISGQRALTKAKRDDELAVYIAEHGHAPVNTPSVLETRLAKFFTGLGDFIVLLAQVVRTKKWKICPIVEIDDDRAAA